MEGGGRLYGGPVGSSENRLRVRTLRRGTRRGLSVWEGRSVRRHTDSGLGPYIGVPGGRRLWVGPVGSSVHWCRVRILCRHTRW